MYRKCFYIVALLLTLVTNLKNWLQAIGSYIDLSSVFGSTTISQESSGKNCFDNVLTSSYSLYMHLRAFSNAFRVAAMQCIRAGCMHLIQSEEDEKDHKSHL